MYWRDDAHHLPDAWDAELRERGCGGIGLSGHEDLSRQICGRFRLLVVDQMIDIIRPTQLDGWLPYFDAAAVRYVAAPFVSAAVIRTNKVITSRVPSRAGCG